MNEMINPDPDSKRRSYSPYGRLRCSFACSRSARLQPRRAAPIQPWRSTGQVIVRSNMRPIPASPDASRGICDESRPAPRKRACFSPQVPAYPIPLNDCSLVLPPLSEYGTKVESVVTEAHRAQAQLSTPRNFSFPHLRAALACATFLSTRGSRDPPPGR